LSKYLLIYEAPFYLAWKTQFYSLTKDINPDIKSCDSDNYISPSLNSLIQYLFGYHFNIDTIQENISSVFKTRFFLNIKNDKEKTLPENENMCIIETLNNVYLIIYIK
jgi:type IV secretory pathway VirB6-like protein